MRRLWSYVVLTGASLVLMGATFANVFKNSTSNIEYADGKEMVLEPIEVGPGFKIAFFWEDGALVENCQAS